MLVVTEHNIHVIIRLRGQHIRLDKLNFQDKAKPLNDDEITEVLAVSY